MASKYELKKSPSGQYMFNLKAANGEVILTSELYTEKEHAQAGIESVKKNSASDGNFERKLSKKDEPYFVLKAANGQIIGKSEMYSSKSAMENGVTSVRTNGPTAATHDLAI